MLPFMVGFSAYILHVLNLALIISVLSLSWSILVSCGQISFGHAAFFGSGAYVSALLAIDYGVPPPVSILISGVFGALMGAGIGGLCFRLGKLTGPYFALSMLAFAEICRIIVINLGPLTRGPLGIYDIPPFLPVFKFWGLTLDLYRDKVPNYYLLLAVLLFTFLVVRKVRNSRIGFAFKCISQDEDAAETVGVDTFRYKLIAITVSGLFAAVSGAFYAHYTHYMEPSHAYSVSWTLLPVVSSLFGGINLLSGPIFGCLIIWCTDEFLFTELLTRGHELLLGALLVIIVIYMPDGFMIKVKELLTSISKGGKAEAVTENVLPRGEEELC